MKWFSRFGIGVLASLMPVMAMAIDNPLGEGQTLSKLIQRIAGFAVNIMGPLAVIVVLIAGAMYMTAGGSEERLKRANKTLLWAVVGIAVVLLATAAEAIIRNFLGVGVKK